MGLASLVACGAQGSEPRTPSGGASATQPTSGSVAAPSAAGGDQLGDLELRRIQDEIKGELPKNKAKFRELCGSDVNIDIDWASFGRDRQALEGLSGGGGWVERPIMAFETVCQDKAGKDAVRAKIKTIRIVNVPDRSKAKASVAGVVLTTSPGVQIADVAEVVTKAL
jgi:hypothetical protein